MTQFAKYCRTLLAGSLVFGGAVAISVVGASLSASPAAAATPPSHSAISREGPLRLGPPVRSNGLLQSILPALGSSGDSLLGGLLDQPENSKADQNGKDDQNGKADRVFVGHRAFAQCHGRFGSVQIGVMCFGERCVAVGYYVNKAGVQVALAEAWNGTKWSIEKLPKIPGVLASAFSAVLCTSSTACTAVGGYSNSPGIQVTLTEVLSGTKWSIETAPNVAGVPLTSFVGVSCTSAKECIAVGDSENSSGTFTTLVENRKGTSWSIESSPNPAGGEGSLLSGVSCTSTSACTAVGEYENSSSTQLTLAEAWNGTSWSIETTPNPQVPKAVFSMVWPVPRPAPVPPWGDIRTAPTPS